MAEKITSVRCQLIPLDGMTLVLPNTTIAEIVSYKKPEAISGAPKWVAGMYYWRGINIPLVYFEATTQVDVPSINRRSRVIVLNGHGDHQQLPFYGIIAQSIPSLIQLDETNIKMSDDTFDLTPFTRMLTKIAGHTAVIPNLEILETEMIKSNLRIQHRDPENLSA